MFEQTFMQVSQISIGIAGGSHPLVDLENVNTGPRYVFVRQGAQHDPRSMATTDCHDEPAAICDRRPSILGDDGGGSFRGGLRVGNHFKRHSKVSSSLSAVASDLGLTSPASR